MKTQRFKTPLALTLLMGLLLAGLTHNATAQERKSQVTVMTKGAKVEIINDVVYLNGEEVTIEDGKLSFTDDDGEQHVIHIEKGEDGEYHVMVGGEGGEGRVMMFREGGGPDGGRMRMRRGDENLFTERGEGGTFVFREGEGPEAGRMRMRSGEGGPGNRMIWREGGEGAKVRIFRDGDHMNAFRFEDDGENAFVVMDRFDLEGNLFDNQPHAMALMERLQGAHMGASPEQREMQREIMQMERESREMAMQARRAEADARVALEEQLQEQLEAIFTKKMALRQQHIEQMRAQLEEVRRTYDERMQERARIIERRKAELLGTGDTLEW